MYLLDTSIIPGVVGYNGPVVEVDGEDEWVVQDHVDGSVRLGFSTLLNLISYSVAQVLG